MNTEKEICPECKGEKVVYDDFGAGNCPTCHGTGKAQASVYGASLIIAPPAQAETPQDNAFFRGMEECKKLNAPMVEKLRADLAACREELAHFKEICRLDEVVIVDRTNSLRAAESALAKETQRADQEQNAATQYAKTIHDLRESLAKVTAERDEARRTARDWKKVIDDLRDQISESFGELESKDGSIQAKVNAIYLRVNTLEQEVQDDSLLMQEGTKQIEAYRARVAELEKELVALGELAVVDFDDAVVGRVDAVVKEPQKYKDILRALFITGPEKLKAAEQDNAALDQKINKVCVELNRAEQSVTTLRKALEWIAKSGWSPHSSTFENAHLAYDCHCEAAAALAATAPKDKP